MTNRLHDLHQAGVSIWLDFIERKILRNGDLERRVREDDLTGMTSNPTIFEKALAEGADYDDQIRGADHDVTLAQLFELIETTDVRDACDIFRPVFDKTGGGDGFVSIEVSPAAANNAQATVEEATRLWATVDRPNVMVKIPGTDEGAKAVQQCTANGLNINITLLFSIDAYQKVIQAYMAGLEQRVKAGKDIHAISSVASFFVSRVDTEVDKRLDAQIEKAPESRKAQLRELKGKAAIANAKLAYSLFQREFASARWKALEAKGGRVQRILWASTSTKNPAYRDVMYVEDLIGPQSVNTMPPATIEAFRDHGIVARTVDKDVRHAERVVKDLADTGIAMQDVTTKLLKDGIASFQKSFDELTAGLEAKTKSLGAVGSSR